MKPVRILLIVSGVLAALAVVALGLALTPAIQRWAVLRAVQDTPGLKLQLGGISAGFSGVTLNEVQAEQDGLPVRFARLEADFSPLGFVWSRHLKIDRLRVTGLYVDASQLSRGKTEAVAAGAPAAAPGVLAQVRLPFDLSLGEVRIEGTGLLPGTPAQPPIEAAYTITGGGFAPGKEGRLQLAATLRNPSTGAKVSALKTTASLAATLTPQRGFDKISLSTLVDADGPALAGSSQLKVGAEIYQSSVGENYELTVSTLLQNRTENALILRSLLPAGTRRYKGEWALKARTAQIEPFILGGTLPEFDAGGDGRFEFDEASGNFMVEGALQAQVSRLEAIEPAWRAFGSLRVDADFDLTQQGGVLDVRRLQAAVAGAEPVLAIRNTSPLRFDLQKRELIENNALSDTLLHVDVRGLPVAWIRPFVTAADVSGDRITGQLDVGRVSGKTADIQVRGDFAVADLNVVQQGLALVTKAALRSQVQATYAAGALDIPTVELSIKTATGDTLELSGHAATSADPAGPMSFAGRFSAASEKLFSPVLPGAPVAVRGEFDATLHGDTVEIRPGRFDLKQGNGPALLEMIWLQPGTLNLATQALTAREAGRPLARLKLGRLPLGLLPVTQPNAVLGGYFQEGDFELVAEAGRCVLRSLSPLRLTDVSLTQDRQPALTGISIEARPVVEYFTGGRLRVQSGEINVRSGLNNLMALQVEATAEPGQDTQALATFTLEVPALAAQPLFAGAQAVRAGRASGEIRASAGAHTQLEARLTLNGLVAVEGDRSLPVANLGFRGLVQSNGAVAIQAPLLLDNAGRRSDLNFALELTPLGRGYSVDGKLTGQTVELEDLLGVLAVFSASAAPDDGNKPAPAAAVSPDTAAAWAHFSGRLFLDVKSITRGKEWSMTGLTGDVAIDPALISLQKLEATFSEKSRLGAKMEVRFTGGAMPYRLSGDYSLTDFDAGRLFRAIEPGKPPTVEGLFNVSGKVAGNGETPARALERVQGELQVTSRQGIFRGLQRTAGKVSMTSKAVELGASVLGSLFGSDKAVKTAEKVAGQAYFVDQLAQSLGEFSYDLLSVRFARDELLNMNLQEISLLSPEIRLNGRGSVSYVVGRPLLEQPLSVSLSIATRGKVEQLFSRLRLVDGTKDELGYAKSREAITVAGTLAKPDPSAFFTKLATARIVDYLDGE